MRQHRLKRGYCHALACLLLALYAQITFADTISLSLRENEIAEAMDMLAKKERINILLGPGVEGEVSLNLYNMNVVDAMHAIANAAGFVVEQRNGNYFILRPEDAGKYAGGLTTLRSYKIQYSDIREVEGIIKNYLSNFGKARILPERNLLIVEDTPPFHYRVKQLLNSLDREPRQILIEAKILQIQLDDTDTLGFDWSKLFEPDGGTGSFGVQGFGGTGTAGLFLTMQNDNIQLALNALRNDSRVTTLSTPKLLALENQEASVIIGNRLGYKVSVTTNTVTTESIEFLESGIILRVTPAIDNNGRIMLDIHPEVSDGSLPNGIPQQNTTEVTTQVLVADGQTVFIGGLIKHKASDSGNRVNGLSQIPLIGRLFGSKSEVFSNTETVVLITPHVVDPAEMQWQQRELDQVQTSETRFDDRNDSLQRELDSWFYRGDRQPPVAPSGDPLQDSWQSVPADKAASWTTDDDIGL